MPEQMTVTETADPSTTSGDVSLVTPTKVESVATEAILDANGVGVRAPSHDEGALLWELASDAGGLDLNSPYAYMMACRHFPNTCAIAEVFGTPAGFVMGHRIPSRPNVLFVWQVAVLPEFRGLGIAKSLIEGLLEREANAGVGTIEATVTPSNKASAALFKGLAKAHGAKLDIRHGFAAEDFPDGQAHEGEDLFVITPVATIA